MINSRVELFIVKIVLLIQKMVLYLVSCSFIYHSVEKTSNILLLRTAALGDFIFTIPALAALRDALPESNITLLTSTTTNLKQKEKVGCYVDSYTLPWLRFVIPSIIDQAICFDLHDRVSLKKSIRSKVKNLRPDVVIILAHPGEPATGLLKKIIFLRYLGVKCKIIGWHTHSSIGWYRKTQYAHHLYEHHIYGPLRSIEELPQVPIVDKLDIDFPLNLGLPARSWCVNLWDTKHWAANCIVIAVAPGSIQPHKQWPVENYIKLIGTLKNEFELEIVIIGTKNDLGLGRMIVESLDSGIVNLAGETSLSESAALLERCSLLVGNDGGAMHLGAAVGCPVVSIISGIEYPGSIEPWFNKESAVRHAVNCAPCYNFTHCPKGHNRCINDLSVKSVFMMCEYILQKL